MIARPFFLFTALPTGPTFNWPGGAAGVDSGRSPLSISAFSRCDFARLPAPCDLRASSW